MIWYIFDMHNNQRERLIQEICIALKFSQPATHTTIHFYQEFTSKAEEANYSNEVIVCACIFLSGKVFEEEYKIRDIFNAINCVTKLYQIGNQYKHAGYIKIQPVI